jgi:riboflavin synthase alpha subunit
LERTNLAELAIGARVNIECDVIAKYVERQVSPSAGKEKS